MIDEIPSNCRNRIPIGSGGEGSGSEKAKGFLGFLLAGLLLAGTAVADVNPEIKEGAFARLVRGNGKQAGIVVQMRGIVVMDPEIRSMNAREALEALREKAANGNAVGIVNFVIRGSDENRPKVTIVG